MDIKEAREELLLTLESIDKDKLSLPDLKLYADTLKTVSEIQVKSYSEYLAETMNSALCCGYKSPTVGEMKGDEK